MVGAGRTAGALVGAAGGALARAARIASTVVVGAAALGAVVLLAHQYRRWRDHRTAIHIALLTAGFVGGAAWWLGPRGVGTGEPLSSGEETAIRTAAALLLFLVVLTVAHAFDRE